MYRPPQPKMMNYPRFCHSNYQGSSKFAPYGSQFRAVSSHFTYQSGHNRIRPNLSYNEDYWCETCDRGFPTPDILEKHKSRHEKCNIDGCEFVAHPKIITRHIQMQHSSGLYKKIAKLNNPEEIQKWREERKKNYPTRANIEKKVAMIKEKIERGEKMGLSIDKNKTKLDNKKLGVGRKYSNENRQTKYSLKRRQPTSQEVDDNKKHEIKDLPLKRKLRTLPVIEEPRKIKPFCGIQDIIVETSVDEPVMETNNILIEDDDETVPETAPEAKNITADSIVCTALSSLICDYGSSDEEETTVPTLDTKNSIVNSQPDQNTNNTFQVKDVINYSKDCKEVPTEDSKNLLSDDDSGPEEVGIVKSDITETSTTENPLPTENKAPIKISQKSNVKPKNVITKPRSIPSTLLQKLLSQEVRQERNIVLQCIRYIRRNNYFDK